MTVTAVARRKATLVSADAAGYSRLMAADELATIRAITVFRDGGERIAEAHGGRLVDSPGDNLLFEFTLASAALSASLAFQAFVRETNEGYPPADRMQFRIGVHSGEVVVDGGRIYGSGINIAARLERLARPGGICISEVVRAEVVDTLGLEDIGPQFVKNIPHPVHAFFVDVPGQVLPVAAPNRSGWPAIAVLPFEAGGGNADGDADVDTDYLADGLGEDLITTLALWRQFPVIARNSSFTYASSTVDPVVAGAELGAAYLVLGSLRRLDQRVRIVVRLLETESGRLLWADRWSATLDDLFETGAEIAQAISVALRPGLLSDMSERALRQPPADLTAWDYALRGLWHLNRTERADAARAIELLTRAVQLDPSSGFAHGHLAHAHYQQLLHQWTSDREADMRAVLEHAEYAVACDPMDANGYLYRSLAQAMTGRLDEAVQALRRSVELNPSLPKARSLLGQFLGIGGRTDEALRELDAATRLSPRDPDLWSFHLGRAIVYFVAGRYEESRLAGEETLSVNPESAHGLTNVAATSALLGDLPRARAAFAQARRVWPDMTEEALSTLFASFPPATTAQFFHGLRLAGLESPDPPGAAASGVPTREDLP